MSDFDSILLIYLPLSSTYIYLIPISIFDSKFVFLPFSIFIRISSLLKLIKILPLLFIDLLIDYDSSYRSGLDTRSGRDMTCDSSLKWVATRISGRERKVLTRRGLAGKEDTVRFDVL